MRTIVVKNTSGATKAFAGQELTNNQEYILEENEILTGSWKTQSIFDDIYAGDLSVSNGLSYFSTSFDSWMWLSGESLEKRDADGNPIRSFSKSYRDKSRSFATPDYSNPCTWYGDTTEVTGEVMNDSGDHLTYNSSRSIAGGWNHYWINWKRIPNSARQDYPSLYDPKVYVNDVLTTSGFTLDHTNGSVTFESALDPADVVKVDYFYGNSGDFYLVPTAGKKLLIDYIELQFTAGCTFNQESPILFQPIYNGPALPADSLYVGFPGWPANTDLPLKTYYYYDADDFLNESTGVQVGKAFGRLTKDFNILPWDYLTGHTLKPPGDTSTNIGQGEFNKLKISSLANKLVTDCEIATGTVYCKIEGL